MKKGPKLDFGYADYIMFVFLCPSSVRNAFIQAKIFGFYILSQSTQKLTPELKCINKTQKCGSFGID